LIAEKDRLEEARQRKVSWKKWGPYLSERQWGALREDYSEGDVPLLFTENETNNEQLFHGGGDAYMGRQSVPDRGPTLVDLVAAQSDPDGMQDMIGKNGNEEVAV